MKSNILTLVLITGHCHKIIQHRINIASQLRHKQSTISNHGSVNYFYIKIYNNNHDIILCFSYHEYSLCYIHNIYLRLCCIGWMPFHWLQTKFTVCNCIIPICYLQMCPILLQMICWIWHQLQFTINVKWRLQI